MKRLLLLFFALAMFAFGSVNINTAGAEELATLKGIGKVKADAIVEYRVLNGKFKSVDELSLVKGIGDKTLEKIRDQITIDKEEQKLGEEEEK